MWALRRAANPLRIRSHHIAACISAHDAGNHLLLMPMKTVREFSVSTGSTFWSRNLSSSAGAKSGDEEEDLEEGFSDLESPPLEAEKVETVISDDEAVESVDESLGLELEDAGVGEEGKRRRKFDSDLFKCMIDTRDPVASTLNKWTEAGKPLGRNEIMLAMINLRRRRFFVKALQFMEWLDENKRIDFTERDYASRVDLIAKVHGLFKAEKFIEKIPESFRSEVVYRTLLANCVVRESNKKAEEVFNKIRDKGFPLTAFVCNQMLLLYKRTDRKKVADVLKLMEEENVQPSLFTYMLLIDIKGRSYDVSGMEEILEMMKSKDIAPDLTIQAIFARHCIFGDHKDKAEAMMKEIEGDDLTENRIACRTLLPLYALLGKEDEVERIWSICEPDPRLDECLNAIEAYGILGKVENAEKIFNHMVKSFKRLSPKYYNVMLKVYAKHKLLAKGKDLVKKMADDGCKIGPLTWDALVILYVEAGEVEKADSVLQKAIQQHQLRPLYSSYITVMAKYAERGDVHNAEKIFLKLKQSGYIGRMSQYNTLLQAYIKAKVPAYGFRERMKADNMIPNRTVANQLAAVDAFKKTAISQLLD